ncbi:MAG: hypothetical protein JXR19_09160 [Bacteroidia bacterium]
MNWKLSIEYPLWTVAVCLLIAAGYAALLYARHKDTAFFKQYKWARLILPFLRFLLASILLILLLGPLLNSLKFKTYKPILLVAVDASSSMTNGPINTSEIDEFLPQLEAKLSSKYDVRLVRVGNNLTPYDSTIGYKEPYSNLSALFRIDGKYQYGQDISAAVFLSDGIYNKGVDPSNLASHSKWPVYGLAWGDSSRVTDLAIEDVYYNSLVFKDNDYQVQLELSADHFKGKSSMLRVFVNGQKFMEETVQFTSDEDFIEKTIDLPAKKLGLNKIEIQLQSDPSEKYIANNNFSFYVDVVEASKKIEIWSRNSHPDAGMILSAIESNQQYAVNIVKDQSLFTVNNQDVIVLHDWFSNPADVELVNACKAKGIAVYILIGPSFNAQLFNKADLDINLDMQSGWSSAVGFLNSSFEYFDSPESLKSSLSKWAPLKVPFGKFGGFRPADVYLYQKIGNVTTTEPLILLKKDGNYRYAVLAGHGMWRWRLNDYEQNQTHSLVNAINTGIVQFLSVKDKKQAFKVYAGKRIYGESEAVRLLGELYNASLEPIEHAEIQLDLILDGNSVEERVMGERNGQYYLDLHGLEHGAYEFSAEVEVAGKSLTSKASFVVSKDQVELMDLRARYPLLESISALSKGAFFTFDQRNELVDLLAQSESHNASIEEERTWSSLIDMKGIFIVLMLLISLEWLIRKFIGGY